MIKKIFSFSSVFLCLMTAAGYSQPEALPADGQATIVSQLSLKEKIYIHSDKDFYLAGEIVWFKLYCVDGNNQPVNISKVAYVEILDRNNKAVLQAKISLDKNGGNGSFYLPLTLASDYYVLRAYTNWMKNEGNMVIFEKTISVVNTVKVNASSSAGDSIKAHADFFPEGGQLVEGIETNIAFRITGDNNKGTGARGIVVNNAGDTVASFSPLRFGIGHFRFRPEKGRTYNAIVLLPAGKFIQQPFPLAQPYGYVMNVSAEDKERLKITVGAKAQPGQTGETVVILIGNGQAINYSLQKNISYDSELAVYLERSKLPGGVCYITLLNKEHQPVCERLVFNRPLFTLGAEISSNKNVYGARQPVDISVSLKGNGGEIVNSSVSVYEDDSLQGINDANISTYLSLLSELKGSIESPAYYFSNDPGVDEGLDNLMLTHGWRRFRPVEQNKNNAASPKFMPEDNGHVISGRVINVKNGNAVADADCSLSIPSIPFGFYVSQSDSIGIVRFEVPAYYGTGEIIAQVDAPNKNDYRVDFYNPFSDDPSFSLLSPFSLTPEKERRLLEKSIAMQAQNIYTPDSIRQFRLPDLPDTLPFYGRAEYRYGLDDYKRFTTMEEVLREYVTPINVQLRNNKLSLSIFDETTREVYHENILLLLDNVPIQDYNKIFSFDPLKIKKLEVVPRHYIYRSRYFSGIASFETYDGKFNGFELDPALVAVDYEGLQFQREFYSPHYDTNSGQGRIPDLRTTLYWDPQVNINGLEKTSRRFYTSDQKGNYVIVLQGISEKGQPVFATGSFRVE